MSFFSILYATQNEKAHCTCRHVYDIHVYMYMFDESVHVCVVRNITCILNIIDQKIELNMHYSLYTPCRNLDEPSQ